MATWPSTLPAPLVDGYGIEPVEQTVATVMEVGTQRVRRRSFAQVDTVRFAVNLSDTQMAIFRAWLYSTDGADGGAGWFTISLWVGRGGGEAIEARFKGSPKWDMTGNHRWIVTGQIETRPYTASWWDYFAAAELPSLDLDFAGGTYSYFDGLRTQSPSDPFASFITFTRSTTASYIGADGLLKTAAINEPRIEYDPITGECKGLLIEERRANVLLNSDAPPTQNVTVTAQAYTLSFYGSGSIAISGAFVGTLTGDGDFPARASLTFTPTAGSISLTISGTVQFAQLEAGSFPTSYIKTEASAVTRGADNASVTGVNFSSWYRQDEGSILLNAATPGQLTFFTQFISISDGTESNRNIIEQPANSMLIRGSIIAGSVSSSSLNTELVIANDFFRMLSAYRVNDFAAVANGGNVKVDTSGAIPSVNQLRIGGRPTQTKTCTISRLTYWPKRLANTKLQELSA